MTGMDEIETAIGETDFSSFGAPAFQPFPGAIGRDDFPLRRFQLLALQFRRDLIGGHGRGADHRHRNAGGDVGQPRRRLEPAAGGQRQRQRRHHRVPRAGNIEHFARTSGDMGDALIAHRQRKPGGAARDQHRIQFRQTRQQILRRRRHGSIVGRTPGPSQGLLRGCWG